MIEDKIVQEAAARYGSMFDHILEGCQVISPSFHYLYVNEVVARQGHSTREKLLGHTMMEKYPGIENTPFFAKLRRCMEKRMADQMENEFSFPDGSTGWFELRLEPIPEGVFILSLDITERKNLDRAKNEFVAVASHQLRTPLTAVRWYVDLLRAKPAGLSALQRGYLRQVEASTSRMIALITALLNVSRIELGSLALLPEPCDISRMLDDALKDSTSLIRKKHLKVSRRYRSGLPSIAADRKILETVFQNLVANAANYTPAKGKIALKIVLRAKTMEISVADTGIGIPATARGRIFNKFFRADNAREENPEGSGLGLYIVKSVLEQAGGKIRFESQEGKGTTFFVSLPLAGMKGRTGTKSLS